MCNETWDGVKKTAYGAFTNVMQFVLPFVTIIFCYTAIIKKLGQRSAQRPGAPRLVLTQFGLMLSLFHKMLTASHKDLSLNKNAKTFSHD